MRTFEMHSTMKMLKFDQQKYLPYYNYGTVGFNDTVMRSKDADGMTNSVDTDRTAPTGAVLSGSARFAQDMFVPILSILWYFQNTCKSLNFTITRGHFRHLTCLNFVTLDLIMFSANQR